MLKEAKFAYSPLRKALEKKSNWGLRKKQIKAIEDHGIQLAEYNELIKKDFNIDRDSIPLEEQKRFNELAEETSYQFQNLKDKNSPNNLIYKYKIEGTSPKVFSNYQNLIDLFRNLGDGNVNPRETLKNQADFKSDLCEIRKRKSKIKIRRSNKCNTNY